MVRGGYGEPGLTQPSTRADETHEDSGVGLDQVILGNPSYVWRFGQERRLEMLRRYVPLEGARMLDIGCGLGTYVRRFSDFTDQAYGMDIDPGRCEEGRAQRRQRPLCRRRRIAAVCR